MEFTSLAICILSTSIAIQGILLPMIFSVDKKERVHMIIKTILASVYGAGPIVFACSL